MASLIQGYEYDIFISYRQKDNKHDGWVTEFVNNLKGELESTFKEEISVYFDINPHDGLLETHDVDASLKNKLKCLIFIPIISRTYCDPKSFAWEHEFKAFIRQASQDQFGLKIKLPNGNVANRIIPIQIHDLYPEDKTLVEKETGGFLRAIEFIYKEPGVNKPLTDLDSEKTYRIQINKVANALEEVIHSLLGLQTTPIGRTISQTQSTTDELEDGRPKKGAGENLINKRHIKWLILVLSVAILIAVAFSVYKIIESGKKNSDITKLEKSIAVLPFVNNSPDQENTYFINGLMEEILNNLQKIKDFRVLSRTSTEQYKGNAIPTIPEIAKKLDVNYIVEGSGQKYGNTFRLRVQLIAAKNEKHLWGESYEQEIQSTKDIFRIQSQVAQTIASELQATITPDEKQLIEKVSTKSLTALDSYQRGRDEINKYWSDNNNIQALKRAEALYKLALGSDSAFALAYAGLANVYYGKHGNEYETYFTKTYLDSVLILADLALSYDDHLSEGYLGRAMYFINNGKTEQAAKEYEKAIMYNPNDWQAYAYKGWDVYLNDLRSSDYVKGLEYLHRAVKINHGKELSNLIVLLGNASAYFAGFPDEAKEFIHEALEMGIDSSLYLASLGSLEIQYGDFEKGIEKSLKAYSKDSAEWRLAIQYLGHDQYEESLKYFTKYIKRLKALGQFPQGNQNMIGYLYWQNGNKKEAEYWFDEQKRLTHESVKLGRRYSVNSTWNGNAYYDLAAVYAFTGEKEKAYELLRILDLHSVFPLIVVDDIKTYNPLFDSIRDEPEFQKIVKDMEAKYQAEHERVKKWLEEQEKL